MAAAAALDARMVRVGIGRAMFFCIIVRELPQDACQRFECVELIFWKIG